MASCPAGGKAVLATLRAGVVLLLACIFLGPAVVYLQNRKVQPTIVVVRDASQSMNTADAYADPASVRIVAAAMASNESDVAAAKPSRVQIVNELLGTSRLGVLDALSKKGRIQAFDFADQVSKVEVRQTRGEKPALALSLPPLVAEGRSTDLSNAIGQSLATERPAAIVLFTDGQHTGKDDAIAAAREAKGRGVPLFVVGVGDPSRRRNVSVAKVYSRPQAWQEEPFEIDALLNFQDAQAGDVRVELIEQRVGESDQAVGEGVVVTSLAVAAPEKGSGQKTAQFSHTVREPGRFVYRVRVEPIEGDSEEQDNESSSNVVKVLNRERVRVLLVAGAPTWDYRLVQKLLARDKTITVSCWLQTLDEERAQEGTRYQERAVLLRRDFAAGSRSAGDRPGVDRAGQAIRGRACGRAVVHGRAQALRPLADEPADSRVWQAAACQLWRRGSARSGGVAFDESASVAAEGRRGQRRQSGHAVLSRSRGNAPQVGDVTRNAMELSIARCSANGASFGGA
jgi:hypothetical protein